MLLISKTEEKSELMNVIESLRNQLIKTGIKEGFASQDTLTISQELDAYIVKYQNL